VKAGEASGAYADRSIVRFPVVTASGEETLEMKSGADWSTHSVL
jgi:hypothetical protein